VPVEEAVLDKMAEFEINREYARKCILANKHNTITATYYLLLKKMLREGYKQLNHLPKRKLGPSEGSKMRKNPHQTDLNKTIQVKKGRATLASLPPKDDRKLADTIVLMEQEENERKEKKRLLQFRAESEVRAHQRDMSLDFNTIIAGPQKGYKNKREPSISPTSYFKNQTSFLSDKRTSHGEIQKSSLRKKPYRQQELSADRIEAHFVNQQFQSLEPPSMIDLYLEDDLKKKKVESKRQRAQNYSTITQSL